VEGNVAATAGSQGRGGGWGRGVWNVLKGDGRRRRTRRAFEDTPEHPLAMSLVSSDRSKKIAATFCNATISPRKTSSAKYSVNCYIMTRPGLFLICHIQLRAFLKHRSIWVASCRISSRRQRSIRSNISVVTKHSGSGLKTTLNGQSTASSTPSCGFCFSQVLLYLWLLQLQPPSHFWQCGPVWGLMDATNAKHEGEGR